MTLPRCVLPGATYLVTRRCSERRFFLRPCREVRDVLTYCLGHAAGRSGVEVVAWIVLGNHVHLVIHDPARRLPDLMQHLDGLVARALNVYLGRGESFWAPGSYSAVALVDRADVVAKLVYLMANAVAGGLVARPEQWPGLRSLPEDVGCARLVAARPRFFFRAPEGADEDAERGEERARDRARAHAPEREPLPDVVELALTLPPELRDVPPDALRRELRAALDARVKEIHAERRRAGRVGWLGPRAILEQDPFASPGSTRPQGGLDPRIACRDKWKRIERLQGLVEFWRAYRAAWEEFARGVRDALFPEGTYWMRVRLGARCSQAPAGA